MKPNFVKFSLLFISVILFATTCKTTVRNNVEKRTDNNWIEEMTIRQLQQGYKEGKYTVKGWVKVYLNRISEIDKNVHSEFNY